jgi:hypothetical protein
MQWKRGYSVALGLIITFVPLCIWLAAWVRHQPLDRIQFATNVLLIAVGPGILLREWRRR